MGALGVAIISKKYKTDKVYNFNMSNIEFITKGLECNGCSNNCEILKIFKNNKLVDILGNSAIKELLFNTYRKILAII